MTAAGVGSKPSLRKPLEVVEVAVEVLLERRAFAAPGTAPAALSCSGVVSGAGSATADAEVVLWTVGMRQRNLGTVVEADILCSKCVDVRLVVCLPNGSVRKSGELGARDFCVRRFGRWW